MEAGGQTVKLESSAISHIEETIYFIPHHLTISHHDNKLFQLYVEKFKGHPPNPPHQLSPFYIQIDATWP